jgi:hypothetical protein
MRKGEYVLVEKTDGARLAYRAFGILLPGWPVISQGNKPIKTALSCPRRISDLLLEESPTPGGRTLEAMNP